LVASAVADVGLAQDQHRLVGLGAGGVERLRDRRVVVAVDRERAPAVGLEPLGHVLAHRLVEVSVERDLVVVVEVLEVAQPEVAGERGRLRRHALHEIAVGDDPPDPVREQPRQLGLGELGGERHAHAVGEPLAERAGGHLHARGQVVLGVARRLRSPLAELLQLGERQVVAGEVEQRVEQHRAVAGREHEAVAVDPVRVTRVVLEVARPQDERVVGGAHRQPGVAAVGLLDRVDREELDGIDREAREGRIGGGGGLEHGSPLLVTFC
jgi:hypothetical protein